MSTPINSLSTPQTPPSAGQVSKGARLAPTQGGSGFSDAMQAASRLQPGRKVLIEQGDTLRSMVRTQVGGPISEQRLGALVKQVAQANGLSNPDLILAGRSLDLSSVGRSMGPAPSAALPRPAAHPVLSKTLDRAVDKGYLKTHERHTVEQRIVGMGRQYGFAPDDFARVALMESDGLNPKATNGRCHGIIQFCEGVSRGADSVGLRGRAHEIARMSVPQQLNLVERYLDDVGLNKQPGGSQRLGLDDLYLSVLTPSARQEPSRNVPLNIAGDQARALYVGADRDRGITRQSLTRGLQQHAQQVLSQHDTQGGNTAASQRQHLAARNSYVEVAVLEPAAAKAGPHKP